VDAAKTLLQAAGIPEQIIVDHQVRPLGIDALSGGVGDQQKVDVGTITKAVFYRPALCPRHSTVDGNHMIVAAKEMLMVARSSHPRSVPL
jgi:hypothetical protein